MALTNLDLTLPGLGSSPGELVAENKYLYPSFELPSGTVTVRTNSWQNPSLETSGAGFGAVHNSFSTAARSTAEAFVGSYSWAATCTTAGTLPVDSSVAGALVGTSGLTPVTPGEVVSLSFMVMVPVSGNYKAQVTFRSAGGAGVTAPTGASTPLVAGIWTELRVENVVVPATAAFAGPRVAIGTGGVTFALSDVIYMDAILLEKTAAVGDYFDGNSTPSGDFTYGWASTPNASVSYMLANGILGVSDDGVYQSQEWAAEGTHSAFVPTGKTLTVALAEPSTVKVIARSAGQTMTVGGNAVTSVSSDETLTAFGGTSVVLGSGYWDVLTIVPGVYTGPPFTGSSDYTGYSAVWAGTPDESTSTLSYAPLASPLGDIVSWSITEPTTPHNIHRRNGSTGTARVTAKAREDTYWTISEDANITVDGLQGTFVGTINQSQISPFQEHGEPSGGVTFSIESVLNQLNAERTLAPVVNELLSDVVATYVAAVAPTMTVTWLASTNPTKTYSAWSGNVWDILKTLCAANNIEMALNGSTLLIRDLGTNIVRFDSRENQGFDVENVSLSITPGSGQFVEITFRDSVAIDNQASYNYVDNPSVEVDASGYGVRTTAFGAISGSRVTN